MAENLNRLNDHSFQAAPADQRAVARGNPKTAMAGDGESTSRLSWRDPEQPTVANSPGRGANPGGRARLKAWRRRLVQELKAKGHSLRRMRRRGWRSLPNSCDGGALALLTPSYHHHTCSCPCFSIACGTRSSRPKAPCWNWAPCTKSISVTPN